MPSIKISFQRSTDKRHIHKQTNLGRKEKGNIKGIVKTGRKDKKLIKSSKVKREKVKNLKNFDVGIFLFLFVVYKRNSFV